MAFAAGTHFGVYDITGLIGVGGMGEVYRATDTKLGRDVAIKVLPELLAKDGERIARFEREGKTLAALNHPNIAQIYGLEKADDVHALVMELVEGPTLANRILEGPLPPDEAMGIALQIGNALEAAHERGIIHRDLKPANVKLRPDGTVKVLDFGIAKVLGPLTATSGRQTPAPFTTPAMTELGVILGTAAYMSPEQARGKPVDKRTDVWAFGCVLYEMLTGTAAFGSDDITTTLARVLERDPDMHVMPSGIAPAVRRTIELCLQKDVRKRLHDIGDVRLALEGEFVSTSVAAESRRRPTWRRVLPAAAVVGAFAGGVYVADSIHPRQPVEQPSELLVTRFAVTPPASAPLASLSGSDVAISPDGKRIAYFGQNAGKGSVELYVRELDALEARLIPGTDVRNTGGGNLYPFFSRDGMSIGFFSAERGVAGAALDGTPLRKILDAPQPTFLGATWNADDALIYSAGPSLERASAGGGARETLMTVGEAATVANPVLLPGGRAVLFGLMEDGIERIGVLDLQTREQKMLIEDGNNAHYASTGHVVFARGTTLMAAPFDAARLELMGPPVALLQGVRHPNSESAADFALSDTGTLVYVPSSERAAQRAAVVWVDRSGQSLGRAIADTVEGPRDPRLSPDGTRVALTTGPLTDGDLWSYDLRGSPPIRLAVTGDNRSAVWSPDGTQLAFTVAGGLAGVLYTVAANGSQLTPRRLGAQPVSGFARVWSVAGELIVTTRNATANLANLYVLPATGEGELRELLATEYDEFDPALSRDGRWLAYATNRSGQLEVWVRGYPDGVARPISTNGGYEPRWSADGRELYYLEGNALMAVHVESSGEFPFATPVQLFSGQYFTAPTAVVSSYDVARDGRFLMIQPLESGGEGSGSASIVVVQHWFEELKRLVPAQR